LSYYKTKNSFLHYLWSPANTALFPLSKGIQQDISSAYADSSMTTKSKKKSLKYFSKILSAALILVHKT